MISDFSGSLARANSLSCENVFQHLREGGIRGITEVVERPSVAHDRAGIDYIAYRDDSPALNVDLKEISFVPTGGETPDVLLGALWPRTAYQDHLIQQGFIRR